MSTIVEHMDDFGRILIAAADAVRNAIAQSEIEQSVQGPDSKSEREFHDILASAFRSSGFGTHREQPFPGETGFHLRESDRERCDFALTLDGCALGDPQRELLEQADAALTLFSNAPMHDVGVPPEDAVWLEVKVVRRFVSGRSEPGPNRMYGAEMSRAVHDLHKLHKDRRIRRSALLLVLFTESTAIAERDLRSASMLALNEGLNPHEPRWECMLLPDRIGNTIACVALLPIMPP